MILFRPPDRKIKAFLFDLDGTLVKLPQIWEFFDELLVEALNHFSVTVPPKQIRTNLWQTGGYFETELRSWGIKNYDAFIHHFDVLDYKKRKALIQTGEICLFDDVVVLEKLHQKFRLGILTNTPPDIALLELEALNIKRHFDDIVMLGSVEQNIAKPESAGFLRSLENLRTKPQDAVMVGDSSSDIIGGNQVRMITVLIKRPNQPFPKNLPHPPDFTITDLHELLNFDI